MRGDGVEGVECTGVQTAVAPRKEKGTATTSTGWCTEETILSALATNVGVAVLMVTPDKTTATPTKSRYSPSSTAKNMRRPACTAAESLKIRLPAMVDSPRAIKSRASSAGSGPAVVSSADSSAAGSRSVARGSNSVRDSVLDCPSITPLLMTLVSPSGSRALGGESVSDGLASGTTSVIFSGFILVGPNHCGG